MFSSSQTIFRAVVMVALVVFPGCNSVPGTKTEREIPRVELRDAALVQFRGSNSASPEQPGECDCNNPGHWDGDTLYVFNSAGHPWRSAGPDLFQLQTNYARCEYNTAASGGRWIECTWKAEDGILYGWYHFEPTGVCPGAHPQSPKMSLTAPEIGAVKSTDNGATWHDLGIVLEAPPGTLKCATKNFYFAGGNGDFSVMLDARKDRITERRPGWALVCPAPGFGSNGQTIGGWFGVFSAPGPGIRNAARWQREESSFEKD